MNLYKKSNYEPLYINIVRYKFLINNNYNNKYFMIII